MDHQFLLLRIIFLIALGFWVQKAQSQVVVSPKIGISYMPFSIEGQSDKHRRIDFLVGLSGQIQLSQYSFISPSISFVNRENPETFGWGTPGGRFIMVYKHSDLNIDLIYQRKIYDNIIIGLGGSLIYKLNTNYSEYYLYRDSTSDGFISFVDETDWWKGINLNVLYKLNPVDIKLKYSYFIYDGDYSNYDVLKRINGKNRFDLMVSYPLEFGRNNSRR